MTLFDFFKQKIKKLGKTKIKQKNITFPEIGDWIKKKRNESEIDEKDTINFIQEKINVFAGEFRKKLEIVNLVDVESKKVEDNLKSIVDESRKKYLESAEDFITSLEYLEKNQFEKFTENINQVFLNFNKSSHGNYERVTILIGKEMANIKESLGIFSKDLIKVFEEKKEIIDSFKTISLIELKLKQIKEVEEDVGRIGENILSLNKKITEKKEKEKNLLDEIEKIKKSENYLKNLEKQEKIRLFEGELEKDIFSLRNIIDFKALANFFHLFEEQMNIVKAHKENFQIRFRKDDGEGITDLLDESKLNNEIISDKIKQINYKIKEIKQNKQEIIKDEIEELYSDMTKILLEIGNLNNENSWNNKKKENLKVNKKELIDEIKKEVEKIGGKVDDF